MVLLIIGWLALGFFAGALILEPIFHSCLACSHATSSNPEVSEGSRDRSIEELAESVSVIVPARNEADNLPHLLRSLRNQSIGVGEIIVVDDQSEDGTTEVARVAGVRVIEAGERPAGWLGKPWAAYQGAREAQGRLLLFIDADVRLNPGAVESLLAEIRSFSDASRALPTVSVQPYHRTLRYLERLAMFFNVQVYIGAARRTRNFRMTMQDSCCFGPVVLCGRDEYFRVGGHGSVRDRILEDIELGAQFRDHGVTVTSVSGRGLIEYRMYADGVGAIVEGFAKNILLGARRASIWFVILDILWINALFSAPGLLVGSLASGWYPVTLVSFVFYLVYAVQLWRAARILGNFGPAAALMFPLHLVFFSLVVIRAGLATLFGKPITWKGRELRAHRRQPKNQAGDGR